MGEKEAVMDQLQKRKEGKDHAVSAEEKGEGRGP